MIRQAISPRLAIRRVVIIAPMVVLDRHGMCGANHSTELQATTTRRSHEEKLSTACPSWPRASVFLVIRNWFVLLGCALGAPAQQRLVRVNSLVSAHVRRHHLYDSNSSIGLPEGSSSRICLPP